MYQLYTAIFVISHLDLRIPICEWDRNEVNDIALVYNKLAK